MERACSSCRPQEGRLLTPNHPRLARPVDVASSRAHPLALTRAQRTRGIETRRFSDAARCCPNHDLADDAACTPAGASSALRAECAVLRLGGSAPERAAAALGAEAGAVSGTATCRHGQFANQLLGPGLTGPFAAQASGFRPSAPKLDLADNVHAQPRISVAAEHVAASGRATAAHALRMLSASGVNVGAGLVVCVTRRADIGRQRRACTPE